MEMPNQIEFKLTPIYDWILTNSRYAGFLGFLARVAKGVKNQGHMPLRLHLFWGKNRG